MCGELDQAEDKKLKTMANDAIQEACLTLTEQYFVSKCQNPTPTTKTKIAKRLLDIKDKFDYSKVHATIRAEVSRYQV